MRIRKSAGIFGAHDKNPINRIPFFVIPLYYFVLQRRGFYGKRSNTSSSYECRFKRKGRNIIQRNGMPFVITANHKNTYGRLSRYANPGLMEKEAGAMERAMINKHEETDFYLQ